MCAAICASFIKDDYHAKTGKALNMDLWTLTTQQPGLPQQSDKISCGIFMCAFAYLLSERLPLKVPASCALCSRQST
jgi:Ulp1 family protease